MTASGALLSLTHGTTVQSPAYYVDSFLVGILFRKRVFQDREALELARRRDVWRKVPEAVVQADGGCGRAVGITS